MEQPALYAHAASGYRRRILIEPTPGRVIAELEDDYHRMVVTLDHAGGVITGVDSEMKRAPWTLCAGAMGQLRGTFTGAALEDAGRQSGKSRNCTHLYDLATFAAAHADDVGPVAYDIFISDIGTDEIPADGHREARLSRNGEALLHWRLAGTAFAAPAYLAGTTIYGINPWIATLDAPMAEAARILRWAAIVAQGRAMAIPAGMRATAFPPGSCYNFQPEQAADSIRKSGADIDFSVAGVEPMADRRDAFTTS